MSSKSLRSSNSRKSERHSMQDSCESLSSHNDQMESDEAEGSQSNMHSSVRSSSKSSMSSSRGLSYSSNGFEDQSLNETSGSLSREDNSDDGFEAEDSEYLSKDTASMKDLQFASTITIPGEGMEVTVRTQGLMKIKEYIQKICEAFWDKYPQFSFNMDDYALFSPQTCRWIDTRANNINVAGISLTNPNIYLKKKTVQVYIVMPNCTRLKITVSAHELCSKITENILSLFGLQFGSQEFRLHRNFQGIDTEPMETVSEDQGDELEAMFKTLEFPPEPEVSKFLIKPTSPRVIFQDNLLFSSINLYLSFGEQNIEEGDSLFLRYSCGFISKISMTNVSKKNMILTQMYSDHINGIYTAENDHFAQFGLGALIGLLDMHNKSQNQAHKLDPFAGGANPREKLATAIQNMLKSKPYQNLLDKEVHMKAIIHEIDKKGHQGKKQVKAYKKLALDCEITLVDRVIKVNVSGKESYNTSFQMSTTPFELVNVPLKTGKTKSNQLFIRLSNDHITMLIGSKKGDPGVKELYTTLEKDSIRDIWGNMTYDTKYLEEFIDNKAMYMMGAVGATPKSGNISLTDDAADVNRYMPKAFRDQYSARKLAELMRTFARDNDSTENLSWKIPTFANFIKYSCPSWYIHTILALETGYDQKQIDKTFKNFEDGTNASISELITFSLEIKFGIVYIVPIVPSKFLIGIPSKVAIYIKSIDGWKIRPCQSISILVGSKNYPEITELAEALNLKPNDTTNGNVIYEFKAELGENRSPYYGHEALTLARSYEHEHIPGRPYLSLKDQTYLKSGLTSHRSRLFNIK